MERYGECVLCGECCKLVRITGVYSNLIGQHGSLDEARAYYSFRGIKITEIDRKTDKVLLELPLPCDKLTDDNRCSLHDTPEKKPVICHRYPWYPDDIDGCGFGWK